MRIAEIAPPWFTVPPASYGGIELVVSQLTDRLVLRGHDVTLFASGGSHTKADLVTPLLDPPDPALGALYGRAPVVHTLHGIWTEPSRRLYQAVADRVHLVAISAAQRADNPDIRYAGVVHNGIDVNLYPFVDDKDDFLVYIGRANPDKGPTIAIEVARRAGLPLAMVVKRTEPFERTYWDEIVAPLLHDEVEVYEGITHEQKVDLLGRARAMVFPIQWPEPFGLVMVEAMACGTPVVACPAGAAVELVDEGVTGYLRVSIEDLTHAVSMVESCSPAACRQRVQDHFSADAMVLAYEHIYTSLSAS